MTWWEYIKEYLDYTRRVMRIGWGFLWNLRPLLRVPTPIVTIFGSAVLPEQNEYMRKADALGQLCVEHNISVITGGGPGIMYAANCGAARVEQSQGKKISRSLGITVRGVEDTPKGSVIPSIKFRYFFMRKWFLTRFSSAIVVFPGGIGTLDELFDVLNLEKHKMLNAKVIVFVGKEYWMPLITWLDNYGVHRKMIRPDIMQLVHLSDDIQEVFKLVQSCCKTSAPQ